MISRPQADNSGGLDLPIFVCQSFPMTRKISHVQKACSPRMQGKNAVTIISSDICTTAQAVPFQAPVREPHLRSLEQAFEHGSYC